MKVLSRTKAALRVSALKKEKSYNKLDLLDVLEILQFEFVHCQVEHVHHQAVHPQESDYSERLSAVVSEEPTYTQ